MNKSQLIVLGIDTRCVVTQIGFGSMWEKHTWVEAVCMGAFSTFGGNRLALRRQSQWCGCSSEKTSGGGKNRDAKTLMKK